MLELQNTRLEYLATKVSGIFWSTTRETSELDSNQSCQSARVPPAGLGLIPQCWFGDPSVVDRITRVAAGEDDMGPARSVPFATNSG